MDNAADKLKAEILLQYKELLKKQGRTEEIDGAESVVSEAIKDKDSQGLESLLEKLKEKSQKIDEFEAIRKKILQEAGDIVKQKRAIRELTAEVNNEEAKAKDSKALERANARIEEFASEPKKLEGVLKKMIKLSAGLNNEIVDLTMMVEAGQDVSQFARSAALEKDFDDSVFGEASKEVFGGSEGGPTEFLIAAKTTGSKRDAAKAAAAAFDEVFMSDAKNSSTQTDLESSEQRRSGPASTAEARNASQVNNVKGSKMCTVQ